MSDEGWFVHIHAAISDETFQVYGGHLINAYASASTEIAISPLPYAILRTKHKELNIKVIDPFQLSQRIIND
jgi:predicted DNA-binding protein with PD1-like motif